MKTVSSTLQVTIEVGERENTRGWVTDCCYPVLSGSLVVELEADDMAWFAGWPTLEPTIDAMRKLVIAYGDQIETGIKGAVVTEWDMLSVTIFVDGRVQLSLDPKEMELSGRLVA